MDSIDKVKERLGALSRGDTDYMRDADLRALLSSHDAQAEENKRLREFKARVMAWAENECRGCHYWTGRDCCAPYDECNWKLPAAWDAEWGRDE